jgi:outer membrane receptor for ferrienterochelin and colicin
MTSKKEKKTEARKSLLTGVSIIAAAAAAMGATPAMAQDAEEEEAIIVTGTRLVRQDFEAISPITTVGAEQLELTATLTTESLLNELPQIVPGNTSTSNNVGGEDFSTIDLRGLGINRTLVLVNGERVPAFVDARHGRHRDHSGIADLAGGSRDRRRLRRVRLGRHRGRRQLRFEG